MSEEPVPAAERKRARRRAALGEWIREVAALIVVFPIVDQLVRESPSARFSWGLAVSSATVGLIMLLVGLELLEEDR